ncbi:hypothetical protein DL95DRAFT_472154 [Leptodontidium sp. 2 PMI_412]|nr:hypothetical protein DL95DRAFT_472154 [Leptodontidium sp. 2 PMI_412]
MKRNDSPVHGSIIRVNSVFIGLILSTAALRFWVRFRMIRAWGLDDILLVLALIFALLLSASSLVGVRLGLGKHIWNLAHDSKHLPQVVGEITKTLYGCYLSYSTAIAFTKFSIVATYIRIFPEGRLRKITLGIGVLVLGFWLSSVFAIVFSCIPVQAAWDENVKGHCYPIVNFFYAFSAFNITTDVLLCFLPIPTLWALRIPRWQRVVSWCLLSMGTFACVASILRLSYLPSGGEYDISYQAVSSLNWLVAEVDTGILCASLSALRPLAKLFISKFSTHSSPASSLSDRLPITFSSTDRILPVQAIISKPEPAPRPSNSKASSKTSIQRTFEVVQTMKELPALPPVLLVTPARLSALPQVPKSACSRRD